MLTKIIITVSGVFLIVLVNWYFFFSRRKETTASINKGELQEVDELSFKSDEYDKKDNAN